MRRQVFVASLSDKSECIKTATLSHWQFSIDSNIARYDTTLIATEIAMRIFWCRACYHNQALLPSPIGNSTW
jgi:hypothetical protein